MAVRRELTDFGFVYGDAEVSRCMERDGRVYIEVTTSRPKQKLTVYVTRFGKVRVFKGDEQRELK